VANVKTDAARVVRRKHLRARSTRECFYTRLGGNLSLAAAAAAGGTSLGACVRLSSATTRQLSLCPSRRGRHAWCHDALSSSCTYSALERDSGWSAPGGGPDTQTDLRDQLKSEYFLWQSVSPVSTVHSHSFFTSLRRYKIACLLAYAYLLTYSLTHLKNLHAAGYAVVLSLFLLKYLSIPVVFNAI